MNIQLFPLFIIYITIHAINFQPQNNNAGISFIELAKARISYDSYTILYHIDVTQYKNLTLTVKNFIDENQNLCKEIKDITCETLIIQLTSQLNYMKRDEYDIEAYQQKNSKKRSIEFIGSILHWAFGLLDADTARDYDTKIENLNNADARTFNILNEQTTLIKETIELNNKTSANLQFQIQRIKTFTNDYQNKLNELSNYMNLQLLFTQGITIMKFITMEHHRISQQILRCLEDVIAGKITQLIPKENLVEDLTQIGTLLKENQRLPIDFSKENPLHIFKYSQIATSLYGTRLLLEITIPIIERDIYTVYRIIPIPILIHNTMAIINPSTYYVLTNDAEKEYLPITAKEYSQSRFNIQGEKIIKPAENAHFDFSENCEMSILMNPKKTKEILSNFCDVKIIPTSNYFISINSNDLFYLMLNTSIIITEYCKNQTPKIQDIHTSGLLHLDKNCRITTDKISLRPRLNYKFESSKFVILRNITQQITLQTIAEKIKSFSNFSIPNIEDTVLIQDYTSDFNNLAERASHIIDKTKSQMKWEQINIERISNTKNTIFTSMGISTIIFILILLLIWFLYYKFFQLTTWIKLAKKLGHNNGPNLLMHKLITDYKKNEMEE